MDAISNAILGIVALAVSLTSLVVSYLLLREQNDPEVIVYAITDDRRPTIINLVIRNIGKGIARDVSFSASQTIPAEAFGFDNAKFPKAMDSGPLVNGIPMLHPNETRTLTWGQYGGLKAAGLVDHDLIITATYFSKQRLGLTPAKHSSASTISIKSFERTDASDHNYGKKTAEALGKISDSLESIKRNLENGNHSRQV